MRCASVAAVAARTGVLAMLLGFAACPGAIAQSRPEVPTNPLAAPAVDVAIDVGHHRSAPGATSAYGIVEFDYNLALARTIADTLSAARIGWRLIGEQGDIVELRRRPALAQEAGARLLLSVHHDSVQPRYLRSWQHEGRTLMYSDHARGFSLFVSRENPQLAASLQCASAIGEALRDAGLTPTRHHAEGLDGERRAWADEANGVYFYDGLAVLRAATMPAVLLEAGVIVHREEALALADPARRALTAKAVRRGLDRCLPAIVPGPSAPPQAVPAPGADAERRRRLSIISSDSAAGSAIAPKAPG